MLPWLVSASLTLAQDPPATEEDRGTAPPIEDGVNVGPSLGAVLSKLSMVIMVREKDQFKKNCRLCFRSAMCWELRGSL